MNRLSVKQLLIFVLIFTVGISFCNAQTTADRAPKPTRKGLFGLFSGKKSGSKIKAPKKMSQVKKEQEKKDKKWKEDYDKSLKESQKRAIKIQTPAVQARMKQNQKDIINREKAQKKKTAAANKKTGRKLKK